MIPVPWGFLLRWGAVIAAAAALFAGGWAKGSAHVHAEWDAATVKAEQAAEAERERSQTKISALTSQLAASRAKERTVSDSNTAKVDTYAPPSLPLLPGSFRVYFDATATGEEVDGSRVDDAPPVAPRDVARTAGANNAIARENADLVEVLQAAIRASGCFAIEGEK